MKVEIVKTPPLTWGIFKGKIVINDIVQTTPLKRGTQNLRTENHRTTPTNLGKILIFHLH